MMYNDSLSRKFAECDTKNNVDEIAILNETYLSPESIMADALSVQVKLDKGVSTVLHQKDQGGLLITVNQTADGPKARVFQKEGKVSWRKVDVHIVLKDGSRLIQTTDL